MTKINYKAAPAFLALMSMLLGCQKEKIFHEDENFVPIRVSLSLQSKTWVDLSSSESKLPVYWSDGDRISVNGVASSPLSVASGEKLSSTTFKLRNVKPPYDVIYPASIFESRAEDGLILVNIPVSQAWTQDSFASGSAVLCGTGDDSGVALKNLCAAVCVNLKGTETIKKLTLTSLSASAPIAGHFKLDPSAATMTAEPDASTELSMTLPEEGVTLTETGVRFVFTIPAGTYPEGFLIRFDDSSKKILRNYWLRESAGAAKGLNLKAGQIICFAPEGYDPGPREICSEEDWNEFSAAFASGTDEWKNIWLGKDERTITIGADFTATELSSLNVFPYVLEGNNHTVTITNAKYPLINTLTGEIRNLTIAGTNTPEKSDTWGATVFATNLNDGGTIRNCTNKAKIIVSTSDKTVIGPFVRSLGSGTLENCINESDISATVDISALNTPVVMGGLVASVNGNGMSYIRNCSNKGNLSVTLIRTASDGRMPVHAGYGGLVGSVVTGTTEGFLSIEGCTNDGDVSASFSVDITSARTLISGVGGLVGIALKLTPAGDNFSYFVRSSNPLADEFPDKDGVYMEIKNSTNNGNIFNGIPSGCSSDDPSKGFAGGLAGMVNGLKNQHVIIEGCKTYGKVIAYEGNRYSRASLGTVTGGFLGFGGYVDLTDCEVVSSQIGTTKFMNYSASAGIGLAMLSFKMKRCNLFGNVNLVRAINYTEDNYSLGFTLSTKLNSQGGTRWPFIDLEGSEITDCGFGGSVTYSAEKFTYSKTSGFGTMNTENITASNFDQYIASKSFFEDAYGKGFPSQVTFNGNKYWAGK